MNAQIVYCALCGALFPYAQQRINSVPKTLSWLEEIRAVSKIGKSDSVILTGVGFQIEPHLLASPLDSHLSYKDIEDINLLEKTFFFFSSFTYWGYPFHDACWQLLQAKISGISPLPNIPKILFDLLYSTPCRRLSVFDFGHDYGGAAILHSRTRFTIEPNGPTLAYYADPFQISELRSIGPPFPPKLNSFGPLTNDLKHVGGEGEETWFHRLPPEILQKVLIESSTKDVLKLRLLSRNLSVLFSAVNLPVVFWRSRFVLGHEFDFICLENFLVRDWRSYYFAIRDYLPGNFSVQNRRRIWRLLAPLARLVRLQKNGFRTLSGKKQVQFHVRGTKLNMISMASWKAPPKISTDVMLSGNINCFDSTRPLEFGCRESERRSSQFWSAQSGKKRAIGVSLTKIGSRRYVSGMRVFLASDPVEESRSSRLGYILPSEEVILECKGREKIKQIYVAFHETGLVGIQFLLGDEDHLTPWAGRDENLEDVAFGELLFSERMDNIELVMGFDDLKVVSICLDEHVTAGTNLENCEHKRQVESIRENLWTPCIPGYSEITVGSLQPPGEGLNFWPLLNVDFGGENGLLRRTLIRVTAHMINDKMPIVGLEFEYTSGSKIYGHTGEIEISFVIDGPGGEFIAQIEVIEPSRPYIGMAGLKVGNPVILSSAPYLAQASNCTKITTNYGRNFQFSPELRESSFERFISLPTPESFIITGFVVTKKPNFGNFERLGILCQPGVNEMELPLNLLCSPSKLFSDVFSDISSEVISMTRSILGSNREIFHSYAKLSRVKCIRASCGLPGKSRSSEFISGLRFDYYDHWPGAVIGQWMSEIDMFPMYEEEEIVAITVWLKWRNLAKLPYKMMVGNIVKIRIETSTTRGVTFASRKSQVPDSDYFQLRLTSNRIDRMDAISWFLNSACDYIQVRPSIQDPSKVRHVIVPSQQSYYVGCEKILLMEFVDGEELDFVCSIAAYFQGASITGLSFQYGSGRKRYIGLIESGSCEVLTLHPYERIISFTTVRQGNKLIELEFNTEIQLPSPQGTMGPKVNTKLFLPPESRPSFNGSNFYEKDIKRDCVVRFQDTWHTEMTELKAQQVSSHYQMHHYCPPGHAFAGIYENRKCYRLVGGAVFEPTP